MWLALSSCVISLNGLAAPSSSKLSPSALQSSIFFPFQCFRPFNCLAPSFLLHCYNHPRTNMISLHFLGAFYIMLICDLMISFWTLKDLLIVYQTKSNNKKSNKKKQLSKMVYVAIQCTINCSHALPYHTCMSPTELGFIN